MNKQVRGNRFFILLLLVLLVSLYFSRILSNQTSYEYNTYTLIKDIEKGTVSEILLNQNKETPSGEVDVTFNNGASKSFYVTNLQEIEDKLYEMSQSEEYKDSFAYTVGPMEKTSILVMILPYLFGLVLFFMLFSMMNGAQGGGGNSKLSNFGKSRARVTGAGEVDKTFADVAGLTEEKEQLEEIVDFLKAPKKYTELGARIPKGVLMVGPPGTGKTLLAKAVAGEAGVPFFSISGSDFVEMFVGVGASRVRDLFQEAKRNAPCIIFIDEIDAVARRRGSGLGGGHDEREQTLNQMLVEMDGFGVNEGIIVMAATNRVDILDPAFLRPGRFDRRVEVGRPDVRRT